MIPLECRKATGKAAGRSASKTPVAAARIDLSLAGLLRLQGLPLPPVGIGRVHRLADDEGKMP